MPGMLTASHNPECVRVEVAVGTHETCGSIGTLALLVSDDGSDRVMGHSVAGLHRTRAAPLQCGATRHRCCARARRKVGYCTALKHQMPRQITYTVFLRGVPQPLPVQSTLQYIFTVHSVR